MKKFIAIISVILALSDMSGVAMPMPEAPHTAEDSIEEYRQQGNKYYDEGNYTEAVNCYRKAAEQGDATAQNNLGVMYTNGLGVGQDYAQAVEWYRKAAEQGVE